MKYMDTLLTRSWSRTREAAQGGKKALTIFVRTVRARAIRRQALVVEEEL